MTEVRRAADRPVTRAGGVALHHALSSGRHYDPANTSYGPLVAHDEIVLAPGAGFPRHLHRGVEVVTWVLEGELRHEDDLTGSSALGPGLVQVLSTGAGVEHAEHAGPGGARFLQAWLLGEAGPSLVRTPVDGVTTVQVPAAGAALTVLTAAAGAQLELPRAPLVHVHVARGGVELEGVRLGSGDALRTTGGGDRLTAAGPAELLVWSLPRPAARRSCSSG